MSARGQVVDSSTKNLPCHLGSDSAQPETFLDLLLRMDVVAELPYRVTELGHVFAEQS